MTITSMKFKNDSYCSVREALKKKKSIIFLQLGGEGSGRQNFTFQKVVFKMLFRLF